ncbi:MAG TPA: hypothetical protein VMT50_09980 [Steroidobacteraceae bacterium]|nr:hypothetical protein [Steroidobacteraceae bacterium]
MRFRIEDLQTQAAPGAFIERFAEVGARVRRDPWRIGLLAPMHLKQLIGMPWPAARNFFLAADGDHPLAALGASLSASKPDLGFIGFYECDTEHPHRAEAAAGLIAAAESFLRSSGARQIIAPVDYSSWFPYRFLKPGSPPPYYAWEPVQPPEYHAAFVAAGYAESTEYASLSNPDFAGTIEKLRPALDLALRRGFRFRPFDAAQLLERELPILYRITMEAFRDGYLFEPIPFEAFRELYVPIVRKADFSLCSFLIDPAGRETGFFFGFLDPQHPAHFIGKTCALLDSARGEGLSKALVCHSFIQARERGATRVIHALMRDDAQSRSYDKYAEDAWQHRYVLMEKAL